MTPDTVFIGLGSNLGDHLEIIRCAVDALHRRVLKIQECSPIYETPPWGEVNQPRFMNAVAKGMTDLSPRGLFGRLSEVQREFGPRPRLRYGARTLDLDLLFYGESAIHDGDLIVPHSQAHRRWFVLQPLVDLDPDFIHPVWNTPVSHLLALVLRHAPQDAGVLAAKCVPVGDSWTVVPARAGGPVRA
jgi:2-amino-4-hydroxy-6-hydroxymethyldihydropteridine diphosphokinase